MIRVMLVDDQELVRTGFGMILDAAGDIEVVAACAGGTAAVAEVGRTRPDVVLMDVRMPDVDGIEATRRIVAEHGDAAPKVLMLTTFDADEYVYDAMRAGAAGFLLKDAPADDLVQSIRTVARGDPWLAPAVLRRMVDRMTGPGSREHPATAALASLTDKEQEVLRLVARGLSNAEIGAELYVSEATVKTHVGHVLQKLGLRDRVQAVVLAYEAGVIQPGDA